MPAPKGNKNHLGFHHTKKTKEGISNKLKGKHVSPNTEFKKGCIREKGEKSPNWRGGLTILGRLIRISDRYKIWRTEVLQRDNWTCQTCRKRGRDIEVHHSKKTFSKILRENNIRTMIQAVNCKELWDVDNGVTLCGDCHDLTRRKYD